MQKSLSFIYSMGNNPTKEKDFISRSTISSHTKPQRLNQKRSENTEDGQVLVMGSLMPLPAPSKASKKVRNK